ncbi:MAG: HEAT repeat domain-containing protein, partial [Armatimonadetes bacterium]|nr:HEAT repeat domain-containing protein [Armatimonadota bacterium]
MARLAFKPDASFFRKIAIGAVGTRAVREDLGVHGHQAVELERGSTDTKLWKNVKRKRVRIPDLVCTRCGLRVECRTKTTPELSMSHSLTDEARAWDFGMVDSDYIAFPICIANDEAYWSAGKLGPEASYWHERNWVHWETAGRINYFPIRSFRATPHAKSSTKGVTEGAETIISWPAVFANRSAVVEAVAGHRVTTRPSVGGRRNSRKVPA